ncbi:MAG: histidinol dehydrogenase [Acidobacteriota bacterium]|nr:histidinol dehydrogenase [Acidobacteriota bacterium]
MKITRIEDIGPEFFIRREIEDPPGVREIVQSVRMGGDEALRALTLKFDGVRVEHFRVPEEALQAAADAADPELRAALRMAADNLRRVCEAEMASVARNLKIEVEPGVVAERRTMPIARAGVYVPGGRHPLASSLLMGVVPARTAGVSGIAVCSPPGRDGLPHPAILAAARIAGVQEVYAAGGAQAVSALAYGTESIPRVDKIVGPGNAYVTAAKKIVYGDCGIDGVAGPSEILILADDGADPAAAAADMIAQAEHDPDAQAVLVTDSMELAEAVRREIERRLAGRDAEASDAARSSIERNGRIVIARCLEDATEFIDRKAPEHLELLVRDPEKWLDRFRNYGAAFVGPLTTEALGDYTSGLNHILPTAGAARFSGGLGVRDFLKAVNVLRVDREGLSRIGPPAAVLARAEGLDGHALSVETRLSIGMAEAG